MFAPHGGVNTDGTAPPRQKETKKQNETEKKQNETKQRIKVTCSNVCSVSVNMTLMRAHREIEPLQKNIIYARDTFTVHKM